MSNKLHNKEFPRYTRFRQDRPIPYWREVFPSGAEVPLYYLGWMVRAKGIGDFIGSYYGIDEYIVRPNWRKYGCQPSSFAALYRLGLMLPDVALFGDHHAFIQIAMNNRDSIRYLHTNDGVQTVVRQAILSLGFKEESFDGFTNLMWVRWPRDGKFPELKDDFPCIGEHYWPERRRSNAEDNEAGKGRLPQVPNEVALIIKQEYSTLLKDVA